MEKPILFNTDMVRAILDLRKTQTRRIAKTIPAETHLVEEISKNKFEAHWGGYQPDTHTFVDSTCIIKPPYAVGDTLWVRETWGDYDGEVRYYLYRADYQDGAKMFEWSELDEFGEKIICDLPKWHPSIHMPRAAARIFLKVTGVRVERLNDITEEQAKSEGFSSKFMFMACWDAIYNNALDNPWVWVIEFERMV